MLQGITGNKFYPQLKKVQLQRIKRALLQHKKHRYLYLKTCKQIYKQLLLNERLNKVITQFLLCILAVIGIAGNTSTSKYCSMAGQRYLIGIKGRKVLTNLRNFNSPTTPLT